VGYDRDIFLAQRRGGISRYFAELIGAFQQSPSFGVHPKLLFDRSNNAHLVEQCLGLRPSIPIPRFLIPATHRSHAARRVIYRLSGGRGGHASVDIVHFTYQFPLRRDLGRASKLAMTVMDLIPELEGSPRMDRRSGIRARLLREADLVFCISETTRQLLLEMYPWIEAITVTTPLGVDHSVFSEQAPSMLAPLDVPYVLYVGSRGGYKNFELLIEALANLRRSSSTLGRVGHHTRSACRSARRVRASNGRRTGQSLRSSACLRLSLPAGRLRIAGA
jgi:glycosyltransferase involved in cell wall biosynthesis